ncbi:SAM-dependent methyltransferase [Segeticoccus rhizosphaerae]|uniref:SAM-dependent methyltransferase n=1 Tax=Segeticoccus rhizosphaerae TaxID=1104777 RepID=UPI00126423B9|nr:methyltransferase domain-containing protein [Segeticoccus rhizosphaerae]
MTYTETGLITTIEQRTGTQMAALTQSQLDGIDQFHAGGAAAVDRILPGLKLAPGMTALDVGSGLGGPARQIARSTGCAVVGVDTARSYVDAATAMTQAAGLAGQVSFSCADITEVERGDFDAAYTMHVQMNIADKTGFFHHIGGRLRPGARLATFEVCQSGRDKPEVPLPWSLDGDDSFLTTPADLRPTIEGSGFETIEWVDETAWALEWFHELAVPSSADGAAMLPTLLTNGPRRMANFTRALADGTLTVHRGAFTFVGPRDHGRQDA